MNCEKCCNPSLVVRCTSASFQRRRFPGDDDENGEVCTQHQKIKKIIQKKLIEKLFSAVEQVFCLLLFVIRFCLVISSGKMFSGETAGRLISPTFVAC